MKRKMAVWVLAAVACAAAGRCGAEDVVEPLVDALCGALSSPRQSQQVPAAESGGRFDPGVSLSMWPLTDTVPLSTIGIGIPWGKYGVVSWAALGLAGNTVEEASGVMAAPVANFAVGFRGVGVAAGMNRADVCRGLQVAAGFNSACDFGGAQVGTVNFADETLYGLQAGAYNRAGDVRGGVQIGLVNRAGALRGVQAGLVNVASTAKGVQLGLVNVAAEHAWGLLPLARVAF